MYECISDTDQESIIMQISTVKIVFCQEWEFPCSSNVYHRLLTHQSYITWYSAQTNNYNSQILHSRTTSHTLPSWTCYGVSSWDLQNKVDTWYIESALHLEFHSCSQIARFIGPTWGPPGSCRPQMGPSTLLSGLLLTYKPQTTVNICATVVAVHTALMHVSSHDVKY